MSRALIVVDVQPTFCEGGALPVEGGNDVAQRIAEFADAHRDHYDVVVTTQDWHIDPGAHFSQHPDFVDTWPAHGVAGSAEAELHPALAHLNPDISVKKGQYAAAYSGFEGVTADGVSLNQALQHAGVRSIDVVGLAESHCVCETALDGRKLGYDVRVFSDLTRPTTQQLGQAARRRMADAGITQLPSSVMDR